MVGLCVFSRSTRPGSGRLFMPLTLKAMFAVCSLDGRRAGEKPRWLLTEFELRSDDEHQGLYHCC